MKREMKLKEFETQMRAINTFEIMARGTENPDAVLACKYQTAELTMKLLTDNITGASGAQIPVIAAALEHFAELIKNQMSENQKNDYKMFKHLVKLSFGLQTMKVDRDQYDKVMEEV